MSSWSTSTASASTPPRRSGHYRRHHRPPHPTALQSRRLRPSQPHPASRPQARQRHGNQRRCCQTTRLRHPQITEPMAASPDMTQTDMRGITLRYASTEHIRNDAFSTASDVYALGMMRYGPSQWPPPRTHERQSFHQRVPRTPQVCFWKNWPYCAGGVAGRVPPCGGMTIPFSRASLFTISRWS
jgi:hypothetical protein